MQMQEMLQQTNLTGVLQMLKKKVSGDVAQ